MAESIPDSHKDLLEKPIYATVTTVMPDGQPQSTVVGVDYENGQLRFNTARGRQKEKNLNHNPKVTVMLIDPANGYHWLEVRGTVDEGTEEGAVDHIEKLSWKYNNQKYYGGANTRTTPQTETRLTYTIDPTRIRVSHE